ncbi:MAG: hypothetical protein IKF19_01365 [Bacilli bacterium]|nr:hypothetical protein [Bacilli bacterium]
MFNILKNKINNIKEENKKYNELLNNSLTFNILKSLPNLDNTTTNTNPNIIINNCPDLNKDKAIIISKLIPLEETYLDILYAKEIKTNTEYWLILTNKKIWIINEKYYGIIPYNTTKTCNIIKNNLMSKIININNILLEINGNDNKISNFISIITNNEIRNKIIIKKTKYLCNIIPIYQLINDIHSGISIDINNNIVFHTKNENYKISKEELINYEVLIDNNSIISKNQKSKTSINSFHNSCYTISLRITTNNNTFLIPILEQNSFGTQYNNHDSIYINSINFAKEIVNKLDEICKVTY